MADREDESFDALLRRFREARYMTQADLAERSGLSAQAISMLERGVRRQPRVRTVELLADALCLDAGEREALHAAARAGRSSDASPPAAATPPPAAAEPPREGARRRRPAWRRGGRVAALATAALTALVVATWLGWWPQRSVTTPPIGRLVGARVEHFLPANQAVGPLQTQRFYHGALPASFAGTHEAGLPAGAVPIVSYSKPTVRVASYVASVNRPIILIFRYNAESRMSASAFVSAFEQQSRLIRSAHNPKVRVATSSLIYQYRSSLNPAAVACGYIPPSAYVDDYLAAVYDPFLEGIDRTDQGGFVAWENCTSRLHRPRGLVEFGIGLGRPSGGSCQPEWARYGVLSYDMEYLKTHMPDLAVLEYWWHAGSGAPCARAWQFPADSTTADLWRQVAKHDFGL